MPRPERHVFVCAQSRPPGHPRGSCVFYSNVTKADVAAIFDEHLLGGQPVERLRASADFW